MSKIIKKVKECTVEDLIALGKADNVSNLRIVIDGSNNENKHFDVNIGGVGYGRKLFLDDEVEIEVNTTIKTTLTDALLFRIKHQYGIIQFYDKNETLFQKINVRSLSNISPSFYNCKVEYEELKPTDNPYLNAVVANVRFIDYDVNQLKQM